jgi:hypothetical protein
MNLTDADNMTDDFFLRSAKIWFSKFFSIAETAFKNNESSIEKSAQQARR